MTRKQLLTSALAAAVCTAVAAAEGGEPPTSAPDPVAATSAEAAATEDTVEAISTTDPAAAERIAGLEFTAEQRAEILPGVRGLTRSFEALRAEPIPYTAEPATHFTPLDGGSRAPFTVRAHVSPPGRLDRHSLTEEQIAFCPCASFRT